jgi:hypothetical protein
MESIIYENLHIYLLIFIIVLILTIFIYIKLVFPFWNIQPVYHNYDFWRYTYSQPFKIYPTFHPSIRTRFCKPDIVSIIPFSDATENDKKAFVNLVQCFNVSNENAMCMFNLENMEQYFGGHMYGSYISFYKDILYKLNDSDGCVIKLDNPIGCISSRSGILYIKGKEENVYYIDFMTVSRNCDWLKIQRELFDTHIYKIGFMGWKDIYNNPIRSWIFKRVGNLLKGIVPLVSFKIKEYEIPDNDAFYKENYPEHVLLVEINQKNIRKMVDGLENIKNNFDIFSMTDISNFVELIKKGVIYVYILERKGEVLAIYIFKDTRIIIEDEGSIIELMGSVLIHGSIDMFRYGFLGSLNNIKKRNSIFTRIRSDDLTHSNMLDWSKWYCIDEIYASYYSWNLVIPFKVRTLFIIF